MFEQLSLAFLSNFNRRDNIIETKFSQVSSIFGKQKMSHHEPDKNEIIVYEHRDYKGEWKVIAEDASDLRKLGFNDIISSIKVGKHCKAELFEHVNYAGKRMELTDSVVYIGDKWNDTISSIKIHKR